MVHTKYGTSIKRILVLLLVLGLVVTNMSCAGKGLVTEKYPSEFYRVPKLLPDGPMEKNPTFIVYGDSRPDWRISEKFLKKKNWLTSKMLIFPFYQVYWLGNGILGGIRRLWFTPGYGLRERRMVRDAVYTEARRSQVDFILHTGDMPNNGRRPTHWKMFLRENKVERPLLLDFLFLPVAGNHERTNDPIYGLPNYQAVFPYPLFYVLDFPDAALFVVDSNLIVDQYQFMDDEQQEELFRKWFVSDNPEQPAWLERQLASCDKTFKMIAMHHPPISFGKHHGNWTEHAFGKNLQEKRHQLLKLFQEQGVQIVFCGHEHAYEHNIIRYSLDRNNTGREIHFIVSGGGGVPLRDLTDPQTLERFQKNYRDEGLDAISVKQEKVYHYCLVDIHPDQVTIKVLEVTGDAGDPLRLVEVLVRK